MLTAPAATPASFDKGRALAALGRVHLGRQPALVYAAVAIAAGAAVSQVVAGIALIVAAYAASAAANDIADVEGDTANGKSARPLVTGAVTVREARRFVVASSVIAVVSLLWLAQPVSTLVVVACALGSWMYSCRPVRAKDRPLLSLGMLSFLYFVAPVALAIGQVGTDHEIGRMALALLGLAVCACGVMWDKDVRDESGDRLVGSRTAVVRYGSKQLALWSPLSCATGGAIAVAWLGWSGVMPLLVLDILIAVRIVVAARGHAWWLANASRWLMIAFACTLGAAAVG